MSTREFDVIVWGATGFTGKLVVEYLAQTYGVDGPLRFLVAPEQGSIAINDQPPGIDERGSQREWCTRAREGDSGLIAQACLGASRPRQSPGRPGPWSQTYHPKRRQPCARIHAIQSSQYVWTSLSSWTRPRLTSSWASSRKALSVDEATGNCSTEQPATTASSPAS